MAEYREIQGAAVQSLASNTGTIEGQIWYDNVNGAFKLEAATTAGAWATGGSLNTSRFSPAGFGTYLSAGAVGGAAPTSTFFTTTELYDGSTWTAVNSINSAFQDGACTGPQTASIQFGGAVPPSPSVLTNKTELWDGTCWTTSPATLNTAKRSLRAGGDQASAISFVGQIPGGPPNSTAQSEDWNGTSWTTGASANNNRLAAMARGPVTSAIVAGGRNDDPGTSLYLTNTEEWNGTAFSNAPTLGTGRSQGADGIGNSKDSALVAGGNAGGTDTSNVELYNGSSWSEDSNIPGADRNMGGAGNATNGLIFGGFPGPAGNNNTFEWTGAGAPVTQTITTT